MANNSFKTQSKVDKALYFAFKEQAGIADRIDWRSDEFSAQNNLGASISLRRQSEMQASVVALGNDDSLPSNTQPQVAVGYKQHTEPYIPLTITDRIEVDMQYSIEDLTLNLTADQAYERAIKPAMKRMIDKINANLISKMELNAGQYIAGASGPATASTGAEWLKHPYSVNALYDARGVGVGSKSILVAPDVQALLGPQQATVFKAAESATKTYETGLLGKYAGFDMYASGLQSARAINSTATVTITTAVAPTIWAGTYTFKATIGTADLKAGTRLTFANSAVPVNYVNLSTKANTGKPFTAIVLQDAAVGTGVDVVIAECPVASGDYQNVSAAITTSTTVSVVNTGSTIPSFAFENSAICGASPEVKIPYGVKGRNINIDGINIAMVETVWPSTLQSITKLVAFVGLAVPKPEGIVAIY